MTGTDSVQAAAGNTDASGAMTLLERALITAVTAHAGQKDKTGAPYVLHPIRLMLAMDTDDERLAALLHDVVEDTKVTFADLEAMDMPPPVMEALRLLTHADGEDYVNYVARIVGNPLARKVKLADLRDNMNAARLTSFSEKDAERMRRYIRAYAALGGR